MGETISGLIFLIFGVGAILFGGKDEKSKIRINGKPLDVKIGKYEVNADRLLSIVLGLFAFISGVFILRS